MINQDKKICDMVMDLAGSGGACKRDVEVTVFSSESALTRFADNVISQNVASGSAEVVIRIMEDGRVGRVSLNSLSEKDLRLAVNNAVLMLAMQKPDPELLPLPEPEKVTEGF